MTRIEFRLPQLGMTMQEATIERWHVQVGDPVNEGQDICEIITEKVNTTLPCTVAGTIAEILVGEGEDAEPGAVLAIIQSDV